MVVVREGQTTRLPLVIHFTVEIWCEMAQFLRAALMALQTCWGVGCRADPLVELGQKKPAIVTTALGCCATEALLA